ncbi:MAG: hypothetical protein EIB84_03305 [Spiroplasma poulsonii]|uniref:Putative chitinase-like n=2 Tax=Spiroplasma poulsonii TaxID=2138 RepID=A0A2P6FED6_9MOLU|nr:hypothetical protein [Spiroplasma poulsonii]UXX42205.1 hypothetical protein [Spiroplasma phage MaM-2019a]MBW1241888.1 hypothetical protein [Spiroplasma poulsonii]PQM30410.1 hypothetical protein SMSRO_SF001720 [Spiroplasma poulsonii]PQM31428.1 putative chitinase-like [Spiroplasma poulsonii]PQM31819.1 putative chitinase-like [Spiroplasma poulsonii]
MKKLLSLLSLLTISGSAVPTTIAASPYQKEQTIRVKRQTQSPIFKTNGADIPTEQQIKDKLINKYPHIAAEQIKVKNITSNYVNITIDGFSGETTLTFIVDKSIPLNNVIANHNLGEIDFSKLVNSYEEQIKFRLLELNPQLDTTKINVTSITTSNAKVSSNDINIYNGELNIKYSRPVKSIIRNIELGSIRTSGLNLPTEQQIKDKLKEKNTDLKNNINDFEVKNITSTYAKISFNRKDILSGEVVVNFTSNINLNKIIKNNNLGEFKTENLSNPTKEQIKNKLKEMYTDLDITKINVENISNSSAKIISADENVYTNNVNVNYTVSIDSLNW